MKYWLIVIYALFITAVTNAQTALKLSPLFSNNMVIQQGINAAVFGDANIGQKVSVTLAGHYAEAVTDSAGRWIAKMPVLKAGGPYRMKVRADGVEIILNNIMIGEVWVASGQSNMNFKMNRPVLNSKYEIEKADYPNIREFHVEESVSSTPLKDLKKGEWKICTPGNATNFSAVAYFFARKLSEVQHVAVGIIHTSYSGTPIQAWISADMLAAHPDFSKRIHEIRKTNPNWAALQEKVDSVRQIYLKAVRTDSAGYKLGVYKEVYDDSRWKKVKYPIFASKLNIPGYRLIWVRKEFNVGAKTPAHDLYLSLGEVKMQDITYVNGIEVGRDNREDQRVYRIPAKLIKKGRNTITIRWLSEWGYGRIGNPGDHPAVYSADHKFNIPLEAEWAIDENIEPPLITSTSFSGQPTSLYNAMIAPIVNYGIKGILWYQGEGNAGNAEQYKSLLPLLLTDWRIRWQQGNLPFLLVQLPNYSYGGNGWITLREAQSQLLKYPNVGMVITTDVGDSTDVHPKNKKPVGERLYLASAKVAYGKDIEYLGPTFDGLVCQGDSAMISFSNISNGLMVKAQRELKGFTVAADDKKFYPAIAKLTGDRVIVRSDFVKKPVAVRYNWSANPGGNLYDKNDLPAGPFRTDNW
ncbi:sialate O-acetylesterase [Mucilaginibacter sabulilitoris]|uniref:Sialate O-acetylesterase n=1 Tax=Mucilaginibacter sabulilitoris TaxID=1173583 RepID=A0ABZ0TQY2_9SPHI|nr:sialate O-acetylesterase [Mucilaginibacter sabulilitoris]WPU95549.1 sialate O-acetylesterase [Mucilaginibacter sabulilitoris]